MESSTTCGTNGAITFAQKGVSGVVSDTGCLPGECISERGQTLELTDFDGKFYIKAATNQVLIFSYIGMNTKN
jgi:hypothetical protein